MSAEVNEVAVALDPLDDLRGDVLGADGAAGKALAQGADPRRVGVDPADVRRLDQRRRDAARADQADADPVSAQVEAQHLRDTPEPELGGAVGRVPGKSEQPRGGGDVDDVAATPGLDHRRDEGLQHRDRAAQVDVDHLLPVGVGELVDRPP
jgi:hypothetical protein